MMRVLLIEDDHAMAALTEHVLRERNFIVDTTDLGEDGLEIGKLYDYDIIILDLTLPDIDGYEVLRRLRAAQVHTPVLIMSGRAGVDSKIKALGVGADDFMTKPFNGDELIARIQAVVRRSTGHSHSMIRTGKLVLDIDGRTAAIDNRRLHLTGKEYGVLELLCLRKGVILTKEALLNHLYGGMDEPELKIIDVFVCKLRKKLAAATGGDHYIETVWGRGYVMRDPVLAVDQLAPVPISPSDILPASRAA
jgi:two-component system, cell cycle response regulator CtrA